MSKLFRRLALALAVTAAVAGPAFAQAFDVVGTYIVRGKNPGEDGTYGAEVKVSLVGEVYQLEWKAGGQTAVGVGLRLGDTLSVTWQDQATKEAAVAAFIVMPDGSLKGRWAPVGSEAAGSEDWIRKP
ncbi:hypothetical protein [Zavarzinia compransoris]|uniref:Fibronectin-binding protein n=1 Tax=Zavarzinia compransoris TaxID=1264899 RepID=A0A317EA49_9PROT|nr:hypothetical protein [Zavarzinia compransoris]PWR23988.1 hypothetical protein DKG75_05450 [Zavarzinia compransoris]TDP48246.1 hypothetical protein DES42_102549 [Zavarzinia compransoris]